MKYDLIETGKRIKEIRRQQGLTQEQLADILHVSVSHISKIEIGSKGASVEMLVDIAGIFGISLDYLILGKEKDNTQEVKSSIRNAIEILTKIENKI